MHGCQSSPILSVPNVGIRQRERQVLTVETLHLRAETLHLGAEMPTLLITPCLFFFPMCLFFRNK